MNKIIEIIPLIWSSFFWYTALYVLVAVFNKCQNGVPYICNCSVVFGFKQLDDAHNLHYHHKSKNLPSKSWQYIRSSSEFTAADKIIRLCTSHKMHLSKFLRRVSSLLGHANRHASRKVLWPRQQESGFEPRAEVMYKRLKNDFPVDAVQCTE